LAFVILRLAARKLSLGLLHLVLVILLLHHGQHGSFLHPVSLVDIAHASTRVLDLADLLDIAAGLEGEVNLRIGTMLAEYLAPLPTAIVCTMAVCTGTGKVSAASCCLHPIAPSSRGLTNAATQNFMTVGFIDSLFPKSFLE